MVRYTRGVSTSDPGRSGHESTREIAQDSLYGVSAEQPPGATTQGVSSDVIRQTFHDPEAPGGKVVTEFERPVAAPPLSDSDKAKFGGFLVLFASAWLFFMPWVFNYPNTEPAGDVHARDTVVAIVCALCGLWLIRSSRSDLLALIPSGMAGLGLLMGALFDPGPWTIIIGGELFAAVLILVGVGLHWLLSHQH